MLEQRIREARQLAAELLGTIKGLTHQPYGHAGITFEVHAAGGDYILKTRDQVGAFAHSEEHIRILKRLNIAAPTLLRRGSFRGFDYILLAKVPGRDLGYELGQMNTPQMARLARQIVEIERKVSTLPQGSGYGWTPMRVPGPFASWTAVIERDMLLSPAEVQHLVPLWGDYLGAVQPTCFLDDLTVKNVIVERGEFRGIVDLDEVCYGDPLYWLSLTEVTVMLDVGQSAGFYGEELRRLWGMSEETNAVCDLYNVIQSWFFLSRSPGNRPLHEWSAERLERSRRVRC